MPAGNSYAATGRVMDTQGDAPSSLMAATPKIKSA